MTTSESSSDRERALERDNRRLADENAAQKKQLSLQEREIQKLKERMEREIQRLKEELAKARRTSQNSSKSPSSDIVKPSRPKPKSGRKIGAQPGHPKHQRPPFTPAEIQRTVEHELTCCPDCRGAVGVVNSLAAGVLQQIEVAARPCEVTEHRARWFYCQKCAKLHCAMPASVAAGGLCGPQLTAWIAYLKGGCHASFGTIRKFVRDVLRADVSRGMLAKIVAKASAALETPWEELRQLLPLAKALNIDETGHKDNGRRMQTWVFRALKYTLFKIEESRGAAVLLESLGADFGGVIGCDYFSSYRCYMREFGGVLQFCLAHLIRDVKFLVSLPCAQTREYAERFLETLRELFKLIHRREELPAAQFQSLLEEQRKKILRSALINVPANREAQNLAERLRENGASYFRFITTPQIEPTNNLAEQALRFVVIDRRITQGTRSKTGRQWCERIWSVMATCSQQGLSAYQYIRDAIQAHFTGSTAPPLLPASS